MKLLYLVTEDRYFLSHRLPMARAAQRAGYETVLAAKETGCRAAIEREGIRVIPFPFDRRSLNPLKAARDIAALIRLYRREKPDVLHHIAMKPVLYGSIAAAANGIGNVVNAFPGLGYVFTADAPLAKTLRAGLIPVFRFLLRRGDSVLLLQNDEDRQLMAALRIGAEKRTFVIRGSGIDLDEWPEKPLPPDSPPFVCLFAGRMIGIKGLATLKAAFEKLRQTHPQIQLWLCGAPDPANPGSWTEDDLRAWAQAPNVVYKGPCSMKDLWPQAHLALQPSWGGEGIPKAMLEAGATGRPFVASDVAGCRDAVEEGVNGFLVPPRDAEALASAIARLADDRDLCQAMASRSRAVAANGLSAEAVTAQTEKLYRRFLSASVDKAGITSAAR